VSLSVKRAFPLPGTLSISILPFLQMGTYSQNTIVILAQIVGGSSCGRGYLRDGTNLLVSVNQPALITVSGKDTSGKSATTYTSTNTTRRIRHFGIAESLSKLPNAVCILWTDREPGSMEMTYFPRLIIELVSLACLCSPTPPPRMGRFRQP